MAGALRQHLHALSLRIHGLHAAASSSNRTTTPGISNIRNIWTIIIWPAMEGIALLGFSRHASDDVELLKLDSTVSPALGSHETAGGHVTGIVASTNSS
jgi:hypothetical protein